MCLKGTAVHVIEQRLMATERADLLALLVRAIHELTISGRYFYDAPDGLSGLLKINEAIHRLSEHLQDLADPKERLTPSRVQAVAELLSLLPDTALDHLGIKMLDHRRGERH